MPNLKTFLLATFKQIAKTSTASISLQKTFAEPPGKHGMPVREKRWKTMAGPSAPDNKLLHGFSLRCSALFRQAPSKEKILMMDIFFERTICLRCGRVESNVNDLSSSKSAYARKKRRVNSMDSLLSKRIHPPLFDTPVGRF